MPSRLNVVANSRDGRGIFHVVSEFSGATGPASDYRCWNTRREITMLPSDSAAIATR